MEMMDSNTSLKKNFILNVLLTLSTILFPLITFPYVSRVIGPAGVGKVTFATSIISYFSMFAQLGIPTYGIRVCARVRDDKEELTKTVQELLIINLIMDVISYTMLLFCLIAVKGLHEYRSIIIMMSSTILLTSIGMEWLYRALEKYNFITVSSVAFKILAMILMFLMIHSESDVFAYGVLTVLAASGSFILNFLYARKYVSFKPVGNYDFSRHFRPVVVFFAMSCATTVYTNLDNVMLGFMTSDEQVGYYNAAIKIKSALVSVVTSLGTVLLPRISYYISRNKMDEARSIVKKAIQFVFVISVPMIVYFFIYATESIIFLSGPLYTESILAMRIITPTILIIGISNVTGIQILIPLGKEKYVLYSEVAGAITDLVLNAVLIPKMGSAGAATGTLIAEIVVLIVQYYSIRNEFPDIFHYIRSKEIVISCLIAVVVSIGFHFCKWPHRLVLCCSAALFFTSYFGIMVFYYKNPLLIQYIPFIQQEKK